MQTIISLLNIIFDMPTQSRELELNKLVRINVELISGGVQYLNAIEKIEIVRC